MATQQTTLETLRDLFEYDLQELYYVETELVDGLAVLADEVTDEKIRRGFADHQQETERHVERVEAVFDAIGSEPQLRESATIKGLIEDKDQFDQLVADDDLRNLHYLAAGMKAEHVEITGYEGLLTFANKLELGDEVTDPLQANLDDEETALKELKAMSENSELKSVLDRLL